MADGSVSGGDRIEAVRRFNRFYTRQIGVLEEGLLGSDLTLTEARIVYETGARGHTTATALKEELGLDAGYLSRILARFRRRGLIAAKPSPYDARQSIISLTAAGRALFAALNGRSRAQIADLLDRLAPAEQARLVTAMGAIEGLLDGRSMPAPQWRLRPPQPGDMGWVVQRHGALYAQEYGWDATFEGLVAQIVADFLRTFDAARERCWIAEMEGEPVGSVFLVRHSDEVAKLRLLIVDPRARGQGIGAALVDECLGFARQAGYARVTLWTNSILHAARRIYEAAGFELVEEAPHRSFGHDLVGQTWEKVL